MKKHSILTIALVSSAVVANTSSAATIALVNADFMADTWGEEQFIQNTGTQTGAITGWTTDGLVRGFNLDIDGDGDPTAQAGPRTWGGWVTGDGLRQVGFQRFQAPENALSQDAGMFVTGETYTFSIDVAPGYEGGSQDGFVQILRTDGTLLAESTFAAVVSGSSTSSPQSVSYTAMAADTGAIRVRFGTDTSATGSGTVVFANPSLESIPEPSGVMLIGLSAVISLFRRRR